MRAPLSSLMRPIPFLLVCALVPGCSTGDSGTPLSPEDPPAATSGTLDLTIREIGARPDPDGYTLAITLATPGEPLVRAVGSGGGTIHLPELPPGVHSLRLDGLAEPCSVTGRHPRAFVISAGVTTELEVFVSCPGPGAIVVTTVTRGQDPAVAAYGVSIQGDSAKTFEIGTNDSLRIDEEDLPEGTRWFVDLTDVPDHCRVDLPPTRVGELKGKTVRLAFAVACIPRGSRIAVDVGGSVLVFGGPDVVSLESPFFGDRGPSLSPDRSRVALSRVGELLGGFDLYVVGVDGSGGRWLTDGDGNAFVGPQAWSPDGSRIVYWKQTGGGSDIYVVNVDGSGGIRLTHDGRNSHPAWSPDGSSIVFCRFRGDPLEEFPDLYRMSAADGSGVTRVAEGGCDPAWSPDGSRIAFMSSEPFGLPDLAVIRADGSGFTQLHPASMTSAQTSRHPTWSPDGAWIAYVTGLTGNRIWLVEFDGSAFGEPFPFLFGTAPSWR